MEETKARQISREREIKEGDRNTKYFQAIANQRRRKTIVFNMDGPEGTVQSTKEIIKVATDYYMDLFRFESKPNINIDDNFFDDEEKMTVEENEGLEAIFTKEEVKIAVFGSYSDGAPSPDGLSFLFYQKFWGLVKDDMMAMFANLYGDKLDVYRLNFALITIIPKEKDDGSMNKFRPISLLNCSYKIFTKVLTNRMVATHEILHSVHQGKKKGFILKLDYEKTYDKVNWQFLLEILEKRGFRTNWIGWIKKILIRGLIGVTINNVEGEFFRQGNGWDRVTPLSPVLFNIVIDVLSRMLQKKQQM
jgi:hypothetical protein